MRQFIDVTGKTEEEAINRALEQLKLDRDGLHFEGTNEGTMYL